MEQPLVDLESSVPSPVAARANRVESPAPQVAVRLEFTGTGAEYFRIWAVSLALTLLTFGVYSAWAKVRKTRYFWQNTRLDGFAFNYNGRPVAVLRGRIIALALVVAYTFASGFSRRAGLGALVLVYVAGPWLFLSAQRFKLANTSWRGLRFAFHGGARAAYGRVFPVLFAWTAPGILFTLDHSQLALCGFALTGAAVPWMHHALKAYQHGNIGYGDRHAALQPALGSFYRVYLGAACLTICAGLLSAIVSVLVLHLLLRDRDPTMDLSSWMAAVYGYGIGLVMYVVVTPYVAARVQQIVWVRTTLGAIRFDTDVRSWRLYTLVAGNVALTILTLGLYWPFAAVALARYRVECMTVFSAEPLAVAASVVRRVEPSAIGDGVADLLAMDIGL